MNSIEIIRQREAEGIEENANIPERNFEFYYRWKRKLQEEEEWTSIFDKYIYVMDQYGKYHFVCKYITKYSIDEQSIFHLKNVDFRQMTQRFS